MQSQSQEILTFSLAWEEEKNSFQNSASLTISSIKRLIKDPILRVVKQLLGLILNL